MRYRVPRAAVAAFAVVLAAALLLATGSSAAQAAVSTTPVVGWVPQDGGVHALATDGTWIYLGGDFDAITNPATKQRISTAGLVRISLATGNPDPTWLPTADGDIRTMLYDPASTLLYIGGDFANVNGTARTRLAALATTGSGSLTSWNPAADDEVRTIIQLDPNTLLVGGSFLHIGSVVRNHAAKIGTNGVLDPTFKPTINNAVDAFSRPAGAAFVLMGGEFTTVGGQARHYVAEIDTTAGAPLAWNLGSPCGAKVTQICPAIALITTPTAYYVAAGGPGGHVLNVDPNTAIARWSVGSDGDDQALALIGNLLYVGGHYDPHFSTVNRYTLAAVNTSNGAVDPTFQPTEINPFPGIRAMLATPGGGLAVGGNTSQIGGTTDAKYAYFAPTSLPANTSPTASFTPTCSGATCAFNGLASSDPDGSLIAYSWNFGDGSPAVPGATPSHTYASSGTYPVALTVTDNQGATTTSTQQVPVTVPPPNRPPVASFSQSCSKGLCQFNGTASNDPDGTVTNYTWNFGDGTPPLSGASATSPLHAFNATGSYPVTLTVTDNQSATGQQQTTIPVTVPVVTNPVTFRAAAHSAVGSSKTKSVVVPSAAQPGDTLLLYVTDGSAAGWSAPTGVTGLNPIDTFTNSGLTTTVYDKALVAGDPGKTITISAATAAKAALTAAVYTNVASTSPLSVSLAHGGDITGTSHVSPVITAQNGDLAVTYWGEKSNATTTWTAPASTTTRDTATDTGTGHFDTLLVDSGSPVTAGSYGALTATADGSGQANAETLSLTPAVPVANVPPVAAITTAACTTSGVCTFVGDQSSDPDGTIASYAWDFGDGTTSTQADPTHTYATTNLSPGYTVKLTVTDNVGATNTAQTSLPVTVNQPPIAQVQPPVCVGETCTFDGSSSHDPDGTIASYAWDFGDGVGSDTVAKPSYTYAGPGPFTVTLTVTDNNGATSHTTATVAVPNQSPTAVIDPATCTDGMCSFVGHDSTDPDGTITSYAWDFGDGTTSTQADPNHTYTANGPFTVSLTVTDNEGATTTTTVSQPVTLPSNYPPTAVIDNIACTAGSCSFNGGDSSDRDGTVASYAWTFGDGTGTSAAKAPTYTYTSSHAYTVTLTVTDDGGATNTTTVSVPVAIPPTFRAAAHSAAGSAKTKTVAIPATAHVGDTLLLYVTEASGAGWGTPTGITGLNQVDTVTATSVNTTVYLKTLAAGDPGKTLTIAAGTAAKAVLTAAVYSGVSATSPVPAGIGHRSDAATTSHLSASVTASAGDLVVTYWGEKSQITSLWTAPASTTTRDTAIDNGTGRFDALLVDSAGGVPAGTYGGLTATTDAVSTGENSVTIALSGS